MEAKALPEGKKDDVGAWAGRDMKLVIAPGGRVDDQRGSTTVQAPIQKFEGGDFIVGAFGLSTTFDVEEAPHVADDGNWQKTVEGVELVRIDGEMLLQKAVEHAEQ